MDARKILDPRPRVSDAKLAARPSAPRRRLVFFDNGKLSPPYDRWMPLVEPLIAELHKLGDVGREGCDLLSEPLSSHAQMIARWRERKIDGVVFGLCDAGVTLPTVLLAAATERAGIPTAVLCTDQVIDLAAVTAHFRIAGLPLVLLKIDRLAGGDALTQGAAAAGEEMRSALTSAPEALRAAFVSRFSFASGLSRKGDGQLSEATFHSYAEQHHMGDGLPLVPADRQRVNDCLDAVSRGPAEVIIDELNPSGAPLTVEQAAICAVMAGCQPEQFPLVAAALGAMGAPEYQLHLAAITTHSCGNVVMFSGPAARKAGVASGRGCLGPAHQANATIGRALSLALINVGRAIPGISTLSVQGSPAQFTCCFADRDDGPFAALHRSHADGAGSIVWAHKTELHNVLDHISSTPESLLTTFCRVAATVGGNNSYLPSDLLLILNPEHANVLSRHGWTRADVQRFVFEQARNRRSDLVGRGIKAEWPREWADWDRIPVAAAPHRIWMVVAGAPGPHSMVSVPWGYGSAVIREIRT